MRLLQSDAFISGCQKSGMGDNTMLTAAFGRGRGEGANKVICASGGDVTTLCKEGRLKEALQVLDFMDQRGIQVQSRAYISLLLGCISMKSLGEGKRVHAHIIKSGFKLNILTGNVLVNMYAKCGSVVDARQVFDRMAKRDVVSWTAMIAGYARHGHCEDALKLFWQMQQESVKPDGVTFASILKACAHLEALEQGKQIHAHIAKCGFESDIFVGNALIDMYAKCGSVDHAREALDKMPKRNVVSWNSMISGYTKRGHGAEALKLFWQMQRENVKPDTITFVSTLKACAYSASLEHGKQIHAQISKTGFELDIFVGSALVDMYAKCGSIELARRVFNRMPNRDIVLYTTMIAGYIQHGSEEEALKVFQNMQQENVKPDKVIFVSVLNACGNLAALEHGKKIHADVISSGFESDAFVGSALISMYAKCGNIECACKVFGKISKQDVVSWTVMIAGYAQHGHCQDALKLFQLMQQDGMKLDHISFIGVLSACSHAGLVDEGYHYFGSMHQVHGIKPAVEHYVCMVDLLGRAGHLEEANDFIKKVPLQPTADVWMSLLGACRVHGHVELAKHAAECALELEPHNSATFVLLSNIYSVDRRWNDTVKVRKMMKGRGLKKEPGCSYIEVNNRVHMFVAEDMAHPQMKSVLAELIT